jgi:hypothetical protein
VMFKQKKPGSIVKPPSGALPPDEPPLLVAAVEVEAPLDEPLPMLVPELSEDVAVEVPLPVVWPPLPELPAEVELPAGVASHEHGTPVSHLHSPPGILHHAFEPFCLS